MEQTRHASATRSFKRDRWAWIILALTIAVGVCLWQIGRGPARRSGVAATPSFSLSDDPLVIILAYDRIVTDKAGDGLRAADVRSHFQVLHDNGFTAVGLDAITAFYRRNSPLPAKTVLLMFDGGYLSTYEAVAPLLKTFGWKAVMAVSTGEIMNRNTQLLYWDRLNKMVDSGVWDLASSGFAGARMITVDPGHDEKPFQTHRQWQADQNKVESNAQYYRRIMDDLQTGKRMLAEHLRGYRAKAYVPPWKHFQYLFKDPTTRRLFDKAVGTTFELAFAQDLFGLNNRQSSPLCLKRKHIETDLTGRILADYLEDVIACRSCNTQRQDCAARLWQNDMGDLSRQDGQWILTGRPRGDLWFSGNLLGPDWQIEARIQCKSGQFWLVQQDAEDPNRLWRVGGDGSGLYIQYRDWQAFHNLAAFPVSMEQAVSHKLSIAKRGQGVWLALDQQPLSAAPVRLEGQFEGDIGWVVWQDGGRAETALHRINLAPLATSIQTMEAAPASASVQQVIRRAMHTEAISVPMWRIQKQGVETYSVDTDLYRLLSHRYCLEVIPVVEMDIRRPALLQLEKIDGYDQWLQQIEDNRWRRIILDLSRLDAAQLRALDPVVKKIEYDINQKDRHLLKKRSGQTGPG